MSGNNDTVVDGRGYRVYDFGIVAKDKPKDSDLILVTPIGRMSTIKGPLSEYKNDIEVEGVDHKGTPIKSKLSGNGTYTAKWMPIGGGNRLTPPNVCEGETVTLVRYANEEEIYWYTHAREPMLRGLEEIILAISNRPDKGKPTLDTSYYLLASTIAKMIKVGTSISDGEAAAFELLLNTALGNMQLTDNFSNSLSWDAVNSQFVLKVNELIRLESRKIELIAETVKIEASDLVEMRGDTVRINGEDVSITADSLGLSANSMYGTSQGSLVFSSQTSVEMKTPVLKTDNDIESGGEVRVDGRVTASGFDER